MALKTYSFKEVSVIVGSRPLSALVSVTVGRNEDSVTTQVGADGEVTRSMSNNKTGFFTIVLMQASEDNAFMSALALADEKTREGVVPVTVRDASGNSLHFAEQAWIQKPAESGYEVEAGEREWIMQCAELLHTPAGN